MSVLGGLQSLLDMALDRTVAPGYTSVGYRLRQAGWADDPAPDVLRGHTALVTGANRGIGKAIAAGLARLGATVLLTVRDRDSGEQARDDIIEAESDADVRVEVCDVSDLATVRAFAADLAGRVPRLDVR
jgi:dehydrogenase/reductase SDR family member 12